MESESDSCGPPSPQNKIKKKVKYMQKFNCNWEKDPLFHAWLERSKKGIYFAHCKACDLDLAISGAGRIDIEKHAKTKKHLKLATSMKKQPTLFEMPALSGHATVEKQAREGEIRLAAFVTEHNLALNVLEHLPQLIQKICKDSAIAKRMTCGRTKATAIITNVTGKTSSDDLNTFLQSSKFSLIVDESTDRGCIKHLCLVTRIVKGGHVMDAFFGLVPLQDAAANTLYDHVVKAFVNAGINYKKNMIGFASDGANTMMGQHHSLSSKLKDDIPNLFIMKCICHSFHLCASYACAKLPTAVEDMARDVYNYFQSSPKRIGQLQEFQEFVEVKPHKILHPSQTRWLSLQAVVVRLLEQMEALKLFFTDAVFTDDVQAAQRILKLLKDPANKLYLEFLEFTLDLFNNLNKEMQSEQPKIHTLHKTVSRVLKTFLECYIAEDHLNSTPLNNVEFRNPRHFTPVENMYLGAKVTAALASGNHQLSKDELLIFRLRCLDFLIEGVGQIYKRFEFGSKILEGLEFLDPRGVLERKVQSIAPVVNFFPSLVTSNEIQLLDTEWRLLRNTDLVFNKDVEIQEFWQAIGKLKNGDDSPMFPILIRFVESLLCLPHSSATVERIFSSLNLMKTKQRNKLSTKTMVGLLHTKRMMTKTTCYNVPIGQDLINKMNSSIYDAND